MLNPKIHLLKVPRQKLKKKKKMEHGNMLHILWKKRGTYYLSLKTVKLGIKAAWKPFKIRADLYLLLLRM